MPCGTIAVVTDVPTRALRAMTAALVVALAVGIVLLWPGSLRSDEVIDTLGADELVHGTVVEVTDRACSGDPDGATTCSIADVELSSGATITLPEEPTDGGTHFDRGDDIVLAHYADAEPGFDYAYLDRARGVPLLGLAGILLVVVAAIARWRGARALAGIAAAVAVLAVFVLPSLLDGHEPVLVALVGAGTMVVLVAAARHGVGTMGMLVALGSAGALVVVGLLAWAFVAMTQLVGLAAEDAGFVQLAIGDVDVAGLVLAAVVVGAVGALVEVAGRQVATVASIDDVRLGAALRHGGDHVAGAMTTLVLAYAGAALPVLLVLTQARAGVSDAATSEIVATELVRALVGAVGLAAAVPITTVLALRFAGPADVGGAGRNDPRRYASRAERQLWAQTAPPPTAVTAEPEEPEPPLPPNRAL
jgi:uncharacterized membrane protein